MRARAAISPSKTAAANTTRFVELRGRQRLSNGLTQKWFGCLLRAAVPRSGGSRSVFHLAERPQTRNARHMSALDAGGGRKLRGVDAARLARLLAAAGALGLAWAAAPAAAGGTQVAVVAVAGDVWLTTGFDVVKLDAFTGRVVRRNATRYPFPIELGVSDGNVWVAS